MKRAQASEEEREEFIRRQRETTSQRRAMQKAMETEEQRAERLKRQREYKRMRRQQLKEIREATTGDLMGLPSKLRSRVYAEVRRSISLKSCDTYRSVHASRIAWYVCQ